jgi:D-3-phosphoglycerate dehydrogenase / 2-oxoglutarate reductase
VGGKILVTARSFRKIEGPHLDILHAAGYELVSSPYDRSLTAAEIAPLLAEVDAGILGVDEINSEALAGAKNLKVISRYGVGYDSIDLNAATTHGVVVAITAGANSVVVAELAFALILALARMIPYHDRVVKSGKWNRISGIELMGQKLGIIGMGRIGRELASRAAAFGMKIIYYDPIQPPEHLVAAFGGTYRSFEDLLEESDIISLHLPVTPQTRGLINREALAKMKPTARIVNTSRGALVDEDALYEALSQGKLAGAASDVFNLEPCAPDNPLLTLDTFIAAPHMASDTLQTALRMGLMASENALTVLRGERLPDNMVVNPEVYARGLR